MTTTLDAPPTTTPTEPVAAPAAAPAYAPTARRPIADAFRRTARGAVRACVRLNVHPDVVSYFSIVSSAVAMAMLLASGRWPWLLLVAPLFCYLRLWLNMLDGMVALASGKASRRGEILNELPDRVSDVMVFVGVAHSGLAHASLGYWAAIAALMTAYVGMLGQAVGAKREFGGWMAKPIRMVVLHAFAWATYFLMLTGRLGGSTDPVTAPAWRGLTVLDWACVVVIVGCAQTCAVRLASTMRLLRVQAAMPKHRPPSPGTPGEGRGEGDFERGVTPEDGITLTYPLPDYRGRDQKYRTTEHTFTTHDGVELFYRRWAIPGSTPTRSLMLFHRGHEHSARWDETVQNLDLGVDFAVYAWDQRGHGRSPGDRGSAPNVAAIAKDADVFARHLAAAHNVRLEETVVVAHSVGAVVAAAWVHDYAPPIRGVVLATPALRVKLYVPFAIGALRLRQKLLGGGYVKSYVKSKVLTHDPAQQAAYDADPAIFKQIAVNVLLDLYDTGTRLVADAGAITTPTLVLAAGSDWVVSRKAQWQFFERLSSAVKQFEVLPGFFHAVFHERDRRLVVDRVRQFTNECFDRPIVRDALLTADRGGYTRTEFDQLRAPSRQLKWQFVRASMNTIGRLSDGVRLGWTSGFDSGLTLDYVYANRPAGVTPLGRMIDRNYLNSIGWRGIRARRQNLEAMLLRAMRETAAAGKPVHVMDIATGAGRYVLETMAKSRELPNADSRLPIEERDGPTPGTDSSIGDRQSTRGDSPTALLRDYRQANLDAARELAQQLGLADRVRFQVGDAFDRESLAGTDPKPTIGIVSGLYELFPDNAPVRRSLAGLADAIAAGGYLIYTGQPWHPQVEFIARALTNREGQPWVMRRRTQQEMDELVRAARFEKMDQSIDEWGIFTVSLARRIG